MKVSQTHEVLTTFLAEVCTFVNTCPLVPVSTDPDVPEILTPAALLTMKATPLRAPPGDFGHPTDIFGYQWRRVQHLANTFWSRWHKEYLPTLQPRTRWQVKKDNLCVSDIVLLKADAHKNDWPYETLPSAHNQVRKVRIGTMKDGKPHIYLRPVTEVIR